MSADLNEVIGNTPWSPSSNSNRESSIPLSREESSAVKTSKASSDFSRLKKQLDFTIEDLEDAPGSDNISQSNEEMWGGLCDPKTIDKKKQKSTL